MRLTGLAAVAVSVLSPPADVSPHAAMTGTLLDSTHITFGVLTAGRVQGRWKLEASQFTGREPDEDRYDVESPEQLEPEVDEERLLASAPDMQTRQKDRRVCIVTSLNPKAVVRRLAWPRILSPAIQGL